MKKIFAIILAALLTTGAIAQNPTPVKSKSILLMNGIAHLGNGQVIENSVIGIRDGKIDLVGDATTVKLQQGAYDETISIQGKHVYPGFIAPNSTVGLVEIEAVRATRDYNDVGIFNPNVRSLIAYNTDSKIIPTVRSNGVLLTQVVPRGGMITGTSSVMMLDGWNWEDAVLRADDGVHLNWPLLFSRRWTEEGLGDAEKSKQYEANIAQLKKFFQDAKAYSETEKPEEKNVRFEAMKGIFKGTQNLYIRASYVKDITESISFAQQFGIKKIVIVGGRDTWMVTDMLKENNIAVMVNRVHDLPEKPEDDVDQPFKLPAQLQKAGILYCLQNEGDMEAMGTRNIPFLAGTAAAYGLTKEEAVMSVTSNAAKILGIDNMTGTIENGKDATIFVSTGDALDMRTNNVEMAFIRGKAVDLNNHQKELYEKYKKKYGM